MRVCVLGGAGHIGAQAATYLAPHPAVSALVIADIDEAAARRVADSCGPKCQAARCDIYSDSDLARLIADNDLVINMVGPFFRHGARILIAAINAKCNYVDINDDWEPTRAMMELDAQARKAGVTAVIGMGSSPGLTNLLAAKVAAQLDKVERLYTGWTMAGTVDESELLDIVSQSGAPSAAMIHWLRQVSGNIEVLREGALRQASPVEQIRFYYPGLGECSGWTIGHPEPITFATSYPGLRESYNLMGLNETMAAALREVGAAIDSGALTHEQAARQMIGGLGEDSGMLDANEITAPVIFAYGEGSAGGRKMRVGAHPKRLPAGLLDAWTAGPLAVGAVLVGEGKASGHGVLSPERAFDVDAFFEAFAPLCEGEGEVIELRVESL
ncbi:MAG: saccharopine dehydrogenase NADP-binding domain-containing protein [Hyphomonadaceae bacterium]|nr:saccharopine dehydrogenase NADP-binding domain-containing protein [Hyphomonadaceae bacterium]